MDFKEKALKILGLRNRRNDGMIHRLTPSMNKREKPFVVRRSLDEDFFK
jgi:hypothetical protein